MSEEIDLGANNLSTTEDAFEKFNASIEDDEFITLSDIVPPQPSVPDLSQELNEIPFDNEVVLDSSHDDQVNRLVSVTKPKLLDISGNNVFGDPLNDLEIGGENFQDDDLSQNSNSRSLQQNNILSADGLGAQNYVIEDSAAIIQDSLLSTTVGQSDTFETNSDDVERSKYPRRTKRERIPNSAKYPLSSASSETGSTKRRPGRPKKASLRPTTFEPDSTNTDSNGLFPENGSANESSGLEETTPKNAKKTGRRGKPKTLKETATTTTPRRGGRKSSKSVPLVTNENLNDNPLVESTEGDEPDETMANDNNKTSGTSKHKKGGRTKGKKVTVRKTQEDKELYDNIENNDDADDVCLSKLKHNMGEISNVEISEQIGVFDNSVDITTTEVSQTENISTDSLQKEIAEKQDNAEDKPVEVLKNYEESSPSKRTSKMPIMSDFEYNIDKAVKEATTEEQPMNVDANACLLVEDTSKRRRTAKKNFVYDEGSDEDPFANVESSDDEPKRRKKGSRYMSDDEYVPGYNDSGGGSGRKRGKIPSSSDSEEIDESNSSISSLCVLTKKKKISLSPIKKPLDNKNLVTTITPNKAHDDDIEVCLQTSVIKTDDALKPPAEAWATSNAFENFIAQKNTSLKIKKVSSQEKTDVRLAPLEIPFLDPKELKKAVETSTQTKKASTLSMGVQTSAPYDIPMKTNINLNPQQSEKACNFLSSVVRTTVELGELMSQKSEDFMKKKINTENVTDTFKMDYCVRKSFLLFKLAKHNLMQMEEDLAKQYDQFLEENNLSSCREQPKKVVPKAKTEDSDSDCEIVEVLGVTGSAGPPKKAKKPAFNPKTVILNKELSIKITKKPPAAEKPAPGKKKLEIKGRHAVWINKNVMVKKVTPTQSFLAQDSRNKKPPDTFVTEKMVSNFFKGYYREKILSVCAQFVNTDWSCVQREYACHYFVNELDGGNASQNNNDAITTENDIDARDENYNTNSLNNNEKPKSLFTLCTEAISNCFHNNEAHATQKQTCNVADGTAAEGPVTLFRLCIKALINDHHYMSVRNSAQEDSVTEESNVLPDLPDDLINIEEMNDIRFHDSGHAEDINLQYDTNSIEEGTEINGKYAAVLPLTKICFKKVAEVLSNSETYHETPANNMPEKESGIKSIGHCFEANLHQELDMSPINRFSKKGVKLLFSLCVQSIQKLLEMSNKTSDDEALLLTNGPKLKLLKNIAFESIRNIMFANHTEKISEMIVDKEVNEITDNFTINCVNTLSEEAFERLQVPVGKIESPNCSDGFEDDFDNCDNEDTDFNPDEENETDDNGWAAQLQMQELRSCYTPNMENIEHENFQTPPESHEAIARVKLEPIDDFTDNIVDTSIVKSEPVQSLQALNEMTHIPDSVFTKTELLESTNNREGSPQIPGTASYNVDKFEQFIRSNKIIYSMDEDNDDIFSQSGLRIRRQHEPDLDQGNDTSMSLLVPHTFEPLHIVEAKGCLMECSSDDDGSPKKNTGKKKLDKKKKKTKKDLKASKETSAVKEISATVMKEKTVPENEVAMLTRRMREKIRQEEKKIESSDSEAENLYMLSTKKDKSKKENDKKVQEHEKSKLSVDESDNILYKLNKKTDTKDTDPIESKKLPKNKQLAKNNLVENKQVVDEIQCNNVDSTEKVLEHSKELKAKDMFSGFTALDQNEISNYYKMTKIVYNQIIPSDIDNDGNDGKNMDSSSQNASSAPIINPNEPVELLECEPTMPIFDEEPYKRPGRLYGPKKIINNNKKNSEVTIVKIKPQFTDRHGWHCYSIDSSDTKLYKYAQIVLDKLPESFVKTYMEYQDVMEKDVDDEEVDRLVNLHSLNRSINTKELKIKSRSKGSKEPSLSRTHSRSHSPANSDHFDELAPSDDEIPSIDDEVPPPVPVRSSENHLAKNLLMDDHDSDSDGAGGKKIKDEPKDHDENVQSEKPKKAGPKSKTKLVNVEPESLMLTADKMMNKELTRLHAPIVLQDNAATTIVKGSSPKEDVKPSKKISTKLAKERVKNEDDSSSEEEKQWVSTKEKLLKRMGKKEDAVADDAKRAKLVTEFIERRNVPDRKNMRQSGDGRRARAKKKMLERKKQLRFLKNELFRENADGIVSGKRGAAAGLFKGRKNIRAVIDKKSLARSTVVANMEEFERKRRLNMRQNKLREVLGCEEGVNVLVINDEVCLEYDFAQQRPVVTVHPFFTKVMKAHQYEGVKFMWDACFESLATLETGHPGGGCILAHCMGLGKTLQVLALLHTVLTHPRVGMQRVLVCCPLSTVLNWVDEIHKWIGPVTHQIKVFELSKLRKTYERAYQLEDWYSGGGIFIIGYELFRSLTTLDPDIDEVRPTIINKIRTALLDPGPDIIICDEGHLLKNDCSVLAVAMSRVLTKRRIVLTGTPMQNNLREYFCMVNFIKPNLLGTYSEYSNRFENPIMNGQHRDSMPDDIQLMKARTHILHKVLEGCLQRQEASVLYPYLPKKHEYTVFIPLTQCQWDLYNHYMESYARSTRQSVLKDFHILQKIWSHPQVLHNFHMKSREKKDKIKAEKIEDDLAHEDQEDIKPPETEVWWLQYLNGGTMLDSLDSSNKFVAVFRILHECVSLGDKVLIFSTSLFCLDALEFFLKKINEWSLGQDYYRLDGSVPAEVRQKWCREFNAENNLKTKLFLISTRAGCLGLNMTAANRVIILDTSWNPAHDIQSIFRVYRFGQKKDCYIYRLVALGTMEQKIYERSVTKQAVACRVVDEQQIDRHYNLAELTELYSVDEHGHSVAGGVAVGVCDVALLRVARDAAVHAVHEHDSLLRGSSEQGLPEHERAAAWNQFQQEHEHKQMQNDLNANKAVVALKRLEMEHLRQQAMANDNAVKIESGTDKNSLLVPMADQSKQRGKKPKITTIMPCRVSSEPQPGPSSLSADTLESQQAMVTKITNLLIKHNFMQNKSGSKKIAELVSKVKKMVATGQPMALGPGYDELSASIANVLLHREDPPPMPALTDVAPDKTPDDDPPATRKRGRPKKAAKETYELPPPPIVPVVENTNTIETDGRRRRKAALAAEKQFDIIDLDGDDGVDRDADAGDDWQADDEYINAEYIEDDEPVIQTEPEPQKQPEKQPEKPPKIKPKKPADESSIVLSDDEPVQVNDPAPTPAPVDNDVVPLHPSLLTNSNFIKIVAHTYLAGNPMMDENAATLAAQYSTLKTLKEAEADGKQIESGPVYDIAIQVLGKEVLRKLQAANPKVQDSSEDSSSTSNKLQSLLGGNSDTERALTPTVKKPKIGPKSKIIKEVKQEPKDSPSPAVSARLKEKNTPTTSKISFEQAKPASLVSSVAAPPPRTECILPDHDKVTAPEPVDRKPIILKKFAIDRSLQKDRKPSPGPSVTPVALMRGPAVQQATRPQAPPSNDTICLDSDDQEATSAPPPHRARQRIIQVQTSAPEPVPVALTGPNVRPITLTAPSMSSASLVHNLQPTFFTLSPCGTKAFPVQMQNQPVPMSLSGLGAQSQPVPISLTGPGMQPVSFHHDSPHPVSLAAPSPLPVHHVSTYKGKGRLQAVGMSFGSGAVMELQPLSGRSQPVPISLTGPGAQPVPISLVGPDSQTIPLANPQPVPISLVDFNGQPVSFTSGGAPSVPPMYQCFTKQQTQATATLPKAATPRVYLTQKANVSSQAAPTAVPNLSKKTVCKPGDVFRISKSGMVEILNHKLGQTSASEVLTQTTLGEPPPLTPKPIAPKPATPQPAAVATPSPDYTRKEPTRRQSVRSVSSSSSSSGRSRSASPDPLDILKDVVHIQAPEKPYKTKPQTTVTPSTSKTTLNSGKTPANTKPTGSLRRTLTSKIAAADFKKYPGLSKPTQSVDLTQSDERPNSRTITLKESSTPNTYAKGSASKVASKPGSKEKSNTSIDKKKDNPSKLVGTSKSIILDGKSKSLKVEGASANKMTSLKPSLSSAASRQKSVDKRPAVTASTPALKKKKTEPMTLKDFDIDDIDDIIELD